jgi:hypothetical protein
MSSYDMNNKADSVALGRKLGIIIGFTWFFFAVGTWLAVWLCWSVSPGSYDVSDGSALDRDFYALVAALFGIVPAFILTVIRSDRDMAKQNAPAQPKSTQRQAAAPVQNPVNMEPARRTKFTGLMLGSSTGFLADRGHYSGMNNGTRLHLEPADACKNIVIFGGIGSGKTTRAINPLLQQVLAQDCSALVFDIKGDFRREVDYIAGRVGRTYQVVGDGGLTLNLFRGCTPEVAASYLKSCFIAGGSGSGDGAFWAETATNYCRNLLTLLRLAKGDYSIAGLADLVFSEARRMDALKAVRELEQAGQLDARDTRVWNAVLSYIVDTVNKWDDKFRGNVQGTCEAVLNPFVSPDLVDAFSVEGEHGEADLYELLNSPTVFLVNLPRHKFGNQGARFAYLLIKLRFFTMMSERRARLDVNQERYVAFLCDEYQGIVDSVSDTDFWDKSRSSKCFGILSMQGYSSLVEAVGSNKTADAIMQNWRQRAIFRTEDGATLEMVQRLLGQVDVHIESTSYSESNSTSMGAGQRTNSYSSNEGQSMAIQRQALFDANDFRKLDAQFALFIGNVGDKAADDVIQLQPLFIPN